MATVNKQQIIDYVKACMDCNPDKGSITAVKEACELYEFDLTEQEINDMAYGCLCF